MEKNGQAAKNQNQDKAEPVNRFNITVFDLHEQNLNGTGDDEGKGTPIQAPDFINNKKSNNGEHIIKHLHDLFPVSLVYFTLTLQVQ